MSLNFDTFSIINHERCIDGFKHPLNAWSVLEWGGACAGEIGEACNKAKKVLRFRDGLQGNYKGEQKQALLLDMATEIADGIIYADLWLASAGFKTEEVVIETFNQKSRELGIRNRL